MPPFLLTRRWMAGHVVVLAVAATCAGLGMWQLGRNARRQDRDRLVAARVRLPAVPLEAAGAGAAYRRVEVSGRFDAAREVILRSRSLDGRPGNHVLTPLVRDGGDALLVDRGWVPFELNRPPVSAAAPPSGTVRLSGVLIPPDARSRARPGERLASLGRVDLELLAAQVPYRLRPLYLLMEGQDPPQGEGLPVAVRFDPDLPAAPHLSYAVQWFSFAGVALLTYAALIRNAARELSREARPPA